MKKRACRRTGTGDVSNTARPAGYRLGAPLQERTKNTRDVSGPLPYSTPTSTCTHTQASKCCLHNVYAALSRRLKAVIAGARVQRWQLRGHATARTHGGESPPHPPPGSPALAASASAVTRRCQRPRYERWLLLSSICATVRRMCNHCVSHCLARAGTPCPTCPMAARFLDVGVAQWCVTIAAHSANNNSAITHSGNAITARHRPRVVQSGTGEREAGRG